MADRSSLLVSGLNAVHCRVLSSSKYRKTEEDQGSGITAQRWFAFFFSFLFYNARVGVCCVCVCVCCVCVYCVCVLCCVCVCARACVSGSRAYGFRLRLEPQSGKTYFRIIPLQTLESHMQTINIIEIGRHKEGVISAYSTYQPDKRECARVCACVCMTAYVRVLSLSLSLSL